MAGRKAGTMLLRGFTTVSDTGSPAFGLKQAIDQGAVTGPRLCPPGAKRAQDWSGQVTVWGWGAGLLGQFAPSTGAPALPFDTSLSDGLENLDAAVCLAGSALGLTV